MTESDNAQIGKKIHKRILDTINAPSLKRKRQINLVRFVAAFLLLGTGVIWTVHLYNNTFKIHKGEKLYAKNGYGKIILSNGDSLDIETMANKHKDASMYVTKENGLLSINTTSSPHKKLVKVKTAKNGFFQIQMPDGTLIYLNADSEISYHENFLSNRDVYVRGNAFFEVNKMYNLSKKLVPFRIHGGDHTVEVLGTEFDFQYTADQGLQTTLIEGKIAVKNKKSNKHIFIVPGQQVQTSSDGQTKVMEVDVEEFCAWKEGFYYFKDKTIVEILSEINKSYDFEFERKEIPSVRLTLYIKKNRPLSEILTYIEQTSGYSFFLKGKDLQVNKK